MSILKIPAILDGSVRKKDNSHSLRFVTSLETSKEQRQQIDELFQQSGWLLFCSDEEKHIEIPKDKSGIDTKKPSERLRDVLFVWWKAEFEEKMDYDSFYKFQMESIINKIKEKLP